jgi:hypothetical protein
VWHATPCFTAFSTSGWSIMGTVAIRPVPPGLTRVGIDAGRPVPDGIGVSAGDRQLTQANSTGRYWIVGEVQ